MACKAAPCGYFKIPAEPQIEGDFPATMLASPKKWARNPRAQAARSSPIPPRSAIRVSTAIGGRRIDRIASQQIPIVNHEIRKSMLNSTDASKMVDRLKWDATPRHCCRVINPTSTNRLPAIELAKIRSNRVGFSLVRTQAIDHTVIPPEIPNSPGFRSDNGPSHSAPVHHNHAR